jgi:hypothetical protein
VDVALTGTPTRSTWPPSRSSSPRRSRACRATASRANSPRHPTDGLTRRSMTGGAATLVDLTYATSGDGGRTWRLAQVTPQGFDPSTHGVPSGSSLRPLSGQRGSTFGGRSCWQDEATATVMLALMAGPASYIWAALADLLVCGQLALVVRRRRWSARRGRSPVPPAAGSLVNGAGSALFCGAPSTPSNDRRGRR